MAGEGWWMGFESIDQPGQSSEVEHNPKMSILLFWLERGGRWGLSSSTSPADHQKLNVIQKQEFHFFWLERGGGWGLSLSTSPADHQKLNGIQKEHFIFLAGEGWQMGFESINQPGQSPEVERNPKTSILFFWLERGSGWGSSPSTSPANQQKLNVIQKQEFHFFGWRGMADGVRVYRSAQLIIRS